MSRSLQKRELDDVLKNFKKIDPLKTCIWCHRSFSQRSAIKLACAKCGMKACIYCIQRKYFETDCEDHNY